jgi:hypothetical protein
LAFSYGTENKGRWVHQGLKKIVSLAI